MAIQLADLAVRYGCELQGAPDIEITGVGSLEAAGSGCISFLANKGYRKFLGATRASAVILTEELSAECPVACLIADDPYLVYARIALELHPMPELKVGVHSSAVVAEGTVVPPSCEIAAGAVIGQKVEFGEGVFIGPNCVIADDVAIGNETRLVANVSIYSNVRIGVRCLLHAGVVIGTDGFGIAKSAQVWFKVPQVGGVIVGDDVEMGATTTIDRGAIDNTIIGNGVKLDNQVHIAHNVTIGDHTAIAGQCGVSGSAHIGARCVFGGQVAINGHVEIADDVYLMGRSIVTKSIKQPGVYSNVISVEEAGKWRRIAARIKRLDNMGKRLKSLEKLVRINKERSD